MGDDLSAGMWVSEGETLPVTPTPRASEPELTSAWMAPEEAPGEAKFEPVPPRPVVIAAPEAAPGEAKFEPVPPRPVVIAAPEPRAVVAGEAPTQAGELSPPVAQSPTPSVVREPVHPSPAAAPAGVLAAAAAPASARVLTPAARMAAEPAPATRPSERLIGTPLADEGVATPDDYARTAQAIEEQIGRVIVGQQALVRAVLIALLCEGHVLLEGVPGLGKTQLLKTLSSVVDLEFSRVQFTPDLMPADIVGTQVLEEGEDGRRQFRYRPGPVFASLVLADEINRATPKTQSALLEAMQERSVTVAGETRPLPRPFLVMATQNPLEMEGTYPLPEAQLDRFLIKVLVPFPSVDDLEAIVNRTTGGIDAVAERVADGRTVRRMISLTRQVPAAKHVTRHAVELVAATHPRAEGACDLVRKYVRFGASPRGAQALVLTAKAAALLDGRPNVSIDDVRAMARAALRHRIVLGYEATADGVEADDVVQALLDTLKPPAAGIRGAP